MMKTRVFLTVLLAAGTLAAQQRPAPVISPEVQPDRRVTFRLRAPNAQKVAVSREGGVTIPLEKDDQGVWSGASDPMEPDLYGYSFNVDGVSLMDPANPMIKPNLLNPSSMFHVPGPPSLSWEIKDVPRGMVHHHFYHSGIVGDDRDFYVYTPPNYDASAKKAYPVFFLLHGFSDDASGWTAVGRAHVILDNLIAEGKAKPMVMVMPLGYGAPDILRRGGPGFRNRDIVRRNYERFRDAALKEVLPLVEKTYRVSKDRKDHAIAGLSMGGAESLFTGLNALDEFAYVGAFSSGGLPQEFDTVFPNLTAKANDQLRLLWIACGTEDRLIEGNRKFIEWLGTKDIKVKAVETPGAHTWMVWRRNLTEFAPLLFQ